MRNVGLESGAGAGGRSGFARHKLRNLLLKSAQCERKVAGAVTRATESRCCLPMTAKAFEARDASAIPSD